MYGPIGGSGTSHGEVSQFMSAVSITSKKQEKKVCSGKQQQEEVINQKMEAAQGSNDSSHTDCKDNKGPREQDKLVTKEKAHDKASQTDEVIPRCQEKIREVRRMNGKSIEEPNSSAEVTSAAKELVDIERRILKDKYQGTRRKGMTDLRAMTQSWIITQIWMMNKKLRMSKTLTKDEKQMMIKTWMMILMINGYKKLSDQKQSM